jgi:uncharacterized protein
VEHKPNYPFDFNPEACKTCPGRCCNGKSGNIWVSPIEIENIAKFLDKKSEEFIRDYLRRVNNRFSIKELRTGNNYACLFFDQARNGCTIYPVRPEQCRTFPFWPYFREHPKDVFEECPGVQAIDD